MIDGYKPTAKLRLVWSIIPIRGYENLGERVKVLQQLWTSDYDNEPDEWRDISVEDIPDQIP